VGTEERRALRELFDAALECPIDERAAFLDESCAGDPVLRNELDQLLAGSEAAGAFLERGLFDLAGPDGTIGQRVGPYELIRQIGVGGMGAVFLAARADDHFRKQVAVKLVRGGLASTDIVRRFRQERQILATLEHPNIARLMDGGTTEAGQPYVVMDYIEGQPIDQYCDEHALSLRERLRLFRIVCGAVQYAHQQLVVHRDLKSANILVTADGSPKLLDFGIAKLLKPEDGFENAAATAPGSHLMTPQTASPEQVRGEAVGTSTDVYALGVVLYQLLTGHPPYRFKSLRAPDVARVICEQEPARPSTIVSHAESFAEAEEAASTSPQRLAAVRATRPDRLRRLLQGDLDVIVLTALRKEVSRRYASVEQLSDDLRRHLDGLPVRARKDTLWYRSAKFVRRQRIAVAAGLLVIATLTAGIVTTAREARIADRQRREAEAQRARAEARFNDVRRLADSFLFEFDAAIANLPGATPARRLVVAKALEYLDSLARESAGDPALQRELAAAYDKVGDVQGNYFATNLGDAKGSTASYQKAYAIRKALLSVAPNDALAQLQVAISVRNLGDSQIAAGDHAGAVERYRQAASIGDRLLAASPHDEATQREEAEVGQRLCRTLMLTGDVAGAIAWCRRYDVIADDLLRRNPADANVLQGRALSGATLGNALFIDGHLQEARETLQATDEKFEGLIERDPNNSVLRRGQAMNRTRLANTLSALGDVSGAVASYQRAVDVLQALVAADPRNARFKTDLTYTLLRRVPLLIKAGRRTDARRSASAGLALVRAAAERPGASADDLNEYAWWLATCEPPELRNPVLALQFARRAVATSPNPAFLHTLGWAQYRTSSPDLAVATLERAVSSLADASATGPAKGLRAQIERDLADFKARRVR
jgi:serine/threonine protein kinase/tetratricopeptide (TPR) repeat protein